MISTCSIAHFVLQFSPLCTLPQRDYLFYFSRAIRTTGRRLVKSPLSTHA